MVSGRGSVVEEEGTEGKMACRGECGRDMSCINISFHQRTRARNTHPALLQSTSTRTIYHHLLPTRYNKQIPTDLLPFSGIQVGLALLLADGRSVRSDGEGVGVPCLTEDVCAGFRKVRKRVQRDHRVCALHVSVLEAVELKSCRG